MPTGWTMDALHRLMSFQAGAAAALPHLIVLAAAALVVGWIATRTFRLGCERDVVDGDQLVIFLA